MGVYEREWVRKRVRETESGRAKDISFILGCDAGIALHTLRIKRMCVYNSNNVYNHACSYSEAFALCAGVLLASLAARVQKMAVSREFVGTFGELNSCELGVFRS